MNAPEIDTAATALSRACEDLGRASRAVADACEALKAAIGTAAQPEAHRALMRAQARALGAAVAFGAAAKAHATALAHDPETWGRP